MSQPSTSTIAALVQRFRESPALPSSERAAPPSGLWWRGGASRPASLVEKSQSTDAAVDAALHAYTSTAPPPGADPASSGDVITRALAVIRESRAMYESGVLRGLPPTTPLSHQLAPQQQQQQQQQPLLTQPPAIVRTPTPSRQLPSLAAFHATDLQEGAEVAAAAARDADSGKANESTASSPSAPFSPSSRRPLNYSGSFLLTSSIPLGFAALIPSLEPSELLGANASFRRRPRSSEAAAQELTPDASLSVSSSTGHAEPRAATNHSQQQQQQETFWEDREGQLLGAINQGLDGALDALKVPLPSAAGSSSSSSSGSSSSSTAPAASAAPHSAYYSSSSRLDALVASAEAIHLEDPEVTLARLRRRLAAVDDASASSLAPYTSMFRAAATAVHMQQQQQQQQLQLSTSASSLDATSILQQRQQQQQQQQQQHPHQHGPGDSSLLGQTTIGLLNSTGHSVSVEAGQQQPGAGGTLAPAHAEGSAQGLAGGGAAQATAAATPHRRKRSHRKAHPSSSSSGAATTPALLQKLRAAIDVAGQGAGLEGR